MSASDNRPSNCVYSEKERVSALPDPNDLPSVSGLNGNVDTLSYSERTQFQGPSWAGEPVVTNAQKRKASEAESSSESELTREIIRDWVERANISFQYTKKKASELVKKAKEKMKKSNCNYLECPQCNESFPSEDELCKHFVSEEHLAKVREKSESKTYGDLKTFAGSSQNILSRVLGAPASSVALRVETPASSPPPSPRPPEETIATDVSDKCLFVLLL